MRHLTVNENNIGGILTLLIAMALIGYVIIIVYSEVSKDVPRFVSKEIPIRNENTLAVERVQSVIEDLETGKRYPIEIRGDALWFSMNMENGIDVAGNYLARAAEWEQTPTPVPGQ